jgi:hypothetical protein
VITARIHRVDKNHHRDNRCRIAFATVLFHVKGYTASETIAAFEHADAMIEQAEALGERPDDDLLRFSVLYGQWKSVRGSPTENSAKATRLISANERRANGQ